MITNFSDLVIRHVQVSNFAKKVGVNFTQVLDGILGQRQSVKFFGNNEIWGPQLKISTFLISVSKITKMSHLDFPFVLNWKKKIRQNVNSSYLKKLAIIAPKNLNIGNIDKDGSVDKLDPVVAQVQNFQFLKLIKDAWGQT